MVRSLGAGRVVAGYTDYCLKSHARVTLIMPP